MQCVKVKIFIETHKEKTENYQTGLIFSMLQKKNHNIVHPSQSYHHESIHNCCRQPVNP